MSLLTDLVAKRDAALAEVQNLITTAEAREVRGFVDGEQETLDQLDAQITDFDARIKQMEAVEARQAAAAIARRDAPAVVHSEPLQYNRGNRHQRSYFQDLAKATLQNDMGAQARLQRHAMEQDKILEERAAKRIANAEAELRGSFGEASAFERRAINRTDGTGGYFVPPLWLMDEYIPYLRAGRVVADQVTKMDLPEGTDSINIPKILTATSTAIQTADNASVSSTDLTDTSVSAGVKTIAGQEDVALQLLEQSPIAFDEVVLQDLVADLNRNVDKQVLNGTNASGQVSGLYGISGGNVVTYTNASPVGTDLWKYVSQALSQISQSRFTLQGVKCFMHPRRWFWLLSTLDSQNRPLVVPAANGPFNAFSTAGQGMIAEGYVGDFVLGCPVFIDANVTTSDTAGSGSGQDVIHLFPSQDAMLFEGALRTRVLPEILSGTLGVRFQAYEYIAFLDRYAAAVNQITGSGLAAPSGF